MEHATFVVRFLMASPVILTDGASLDALIAYQGFEMGVDGIALLDDLLAKDGRIHHASWLFIEQERIAERAKFVRMQRTGPSLNGRTIGPSRGAGAGFRVDNKRGIAANMLTTYTAVATPCVWAFAKGDASGVVKALANVTSIGMKRPYGFGRLQRIEVCPINGWRGLGLLMHDGSPARAIPVDQWQGSAKRGAYAVGLPRWEAPPERCAIPSQRFVDPAIFATRKDPLAGEGT